MGVNATITKIHMLQKNINKIIYFMSFMTSERKLSCLMQNVPALISRFLLKAFRKEKLCYTTIKNMVVSQIAHVVVNYIFQDVRFWSYRSDTHEERQDEFVMLMSSYTSSSSLRPPIRKFLSSFPLIAELQRSGEVFLFHLLFWGFVFKEVWFKSELRGEEESERVEMKPEMEERARRDETRVWLM